MLDSWKDKPRKRGSFGPAELAEIKVHSLASLFPEPTADVFEKMSGSVAKDGVLNHILIWRGSCVDGKTRRQLAIKHQVPCPYEELDSRLTEWEVQTLIVANNLDRRHLHPSQRAMLGARLARSLSDDAAPIGANEIAAATVGSNKRSVQRASRVLDGADPAVVKAVEDGDIKLYDAENLLECEPEDQVDAIEEVKSGSAKTATDAVKKSRSGHALPHRLAAIESLRKAIGKVVRESDDLHSNFPDPDSHRQMREALARVLNITTNWKVAEKVAGVA